MGTGMNWEDDWEEEKGLVDGELGRRVVTEKWLIGEGALEKERRVTGSESMTVA